MVGSLVKRKRLALGLTQPELALKSGLRQTYISQVENGEIAMPRDHNLDALGKPLGISRREFYREAGYLNDTDSETETREPRPADLPAPLVEALEEMVRRYPELRAQIGGWRDDPERPARIVDLARFLGIVIRGWVDDLPRSDDGQ